MTLQSSPDAQATAMRVEDLTVSYGHVIACRSISFTVQKGECLAVLGPNGAGKSSLLQGICGVVPARSGAVHLGDDDISRLAAHNRAKAGLSLIPEALHLFPQLTVADTLRLAEDHGRSGSFDLGAVLELFPAMRSRWSSHAGNLSGGERQMLALARGLLLNPSVMMLDEPSSGLAPAVIGEVVNSIRTLLHRGLSLVLVEQNIGAAAALADRVLLMSNGQITRAGGRELLGDQTVLRAAYLGR